MGLQRIGERMSDHDQLATDREVQNFKAALRVLLSDERLLQGGKDWETMVIDKCSVALNTLVELHYDKRHLLDVLRRQAEELEWTRNKLLQEMITEAKTLGAKVKLKN